MLLITATGVFLPLEVALNSVWGVKKNRSYLQNQLVAIGLAIGVAFLAMASVALIGRAAHCARTGSSSAIRRTRSSPSSLKAFSRSCALAASVGLFFLIYWGLPHRKIPRARRAAARQS